MTVYFLTASSNNRSRELGQSYRAQMVNKVGPRATQAIERWEAYQTQGSADYDGLLLDRVIQQSFP